MSGALSYVTEIRTELKIEILPVVHTMNTIAKVGVLI
jgi:hypothetical protein